MPTGLSFTTVHVRDSKTPDGPQLAVSPASWVAFLDVASGA
ncbi:DUF397 domain-containing protein [Streptomyces tanashiensis]|nr:DUF397 domain-containing protein [Streptomyces tanashiensis]